MAVAHARFLEKPREFRKGQTAFNIALKGEPRPKEKARLAEIIYTKVNTSAIASPIRVILKSSKPNSEKISELRKLFFDPRSSFTINNLFHTNRLSEVDKERLFRYVVALIATHAKLQHPFKNQRIALPSKITEPLSLPKPFKPFVGPSKPPTRAIVEPSKPISKPTIKSEPAKGQQEFDFMKQPFVASKKTEATERMRTALQNKMPSSRASAKPLSENPRQRGLGEVVPNYIKSVSNLNEPRRSILPFELERRLYEPKKEVGIKISDLDDLTQKYTRYLDLAISRGKIKPAEKARRLEYLQKQARLWGYAKISPMIERLVAKISALPKIPPLPPVARVKAPESARPPPAPTVSVHPVRGERTEIGRVKETRFRTPEDQPYAGAVPRDKALMRPLLRTKSELVPTGIKTKYSEGLRKREVWPKESVLKIGSREVKIADLPLWANSRFKKVSPEEIKYSNPPKEFSTMFQDIDGKPYEAILRYSRTIELGGKPYHEYSSKGNSSFFDAVSGRIQYGKFFNEQVLSKSMPAPKGIFWRAEADFIRACEKERGQQEFDFMKTPFVESEATKRQREEREKELGRYGARYKGPKPLSENPKQMEIEFGKEKTAQKAVADFTGVVERAQRATEEIDSPTKPIDQSIREILLEETAKLHLPSEITRDDLRSFSHGCGISSYFSNGINVSYDSTTGRVSLSLPFKRARKSLEFNPRKSTFYVLTDSNIYEYPKAFLLGFRKMSRDILYGAKSERSKLLGVIFFNAPSKRIVSFSALGVKEKPAELEEGLKPLEDLDRELGPLTGTLKRSQKQKLTEEEGIVNRTKVDVAVEDLHANAGPIVQPPRAATLSDDYSSEDFNARKRKEHRRALFEAVGQDERVATPIGESTKPAVAKPESEFRDRVAIPIKERTEAKPVDPEVEKVLARYTRYHTTMGASDTVISKLVAEQREKLLKGKVTVGTLNDALDSLERLNPVADKRKPAEEKAEPVKPQEVSIYRSENKHPITVQQLGFKKIEELPALKEGYMRGTIFCESEEEANDYLKGNKVPKMFLYRKAEIAERRIKAREGSSKALCLVVDVPAETLAKQISEFLVGIVSLKLPEGPKPAVGQPAEPLRDKQIVSGEAERVVERREVPRTGPSVQVRAEEYPQGADTVFIRKPLEEETVPKGKKSEKKADEQQGPGDVSEDDKEKKKIVPPKIIPDPVKYGPIMKLYNGPENLEYFVDACKQVTDFDVKATLENKIVETIDKCEEEGRLGYVVSLLTEGLSDHINISVTMVCANNGWLEPIADFLENRSLNPETRVVVEKQLANVGFVNAALHKDPEAIIKVLDRPNASRIFSRETFISAIRVLSVSNEIVTADFSEAVARFSKALGNRRLPFPEEGEKIKEVSHEFESTLKLYAESRGTSESDVKHKQLWPKLIKLMDRLIANTETPGGEIIFRNLLRKHFSIMFSLMDIRDFVNLNVWKQLVPVSKEDINARELFLGIIPRLADFKLNEEQQKDLEHLKALQKQK